MGHSREEMLLLKFARSQKYILSIILVTNISGMVSPRQMALSQFIWPNL
jgi:hypothetical protein